MTGNHVLRLQYYIEQIQYISLVCSEYNVKADEVQDPPPIQSKFRLCVLEDQISWDRAVKVFG